MPYSDGMEVHDRVRQSIEGPRLARSPPIYAIDPACRLRETCCLAVFHRGTGRLTNNNDPRAVSRGQITSRGEGPAAEPADLAAELGSGAPATIGGIPIAPPIL